MLPNHWLAYDLQLYHYRLYPLSSTISLFQFNWTLWKLLSANIFPKRFHAVFIVALSLSTSLPFSIALVHRNCVWFDITFRPLTKLQHLTCIETLSVPLDFPSQNNNIFIRILAKRNAIKNVVACRKAPKGRQQLPLTNFPLSQPPLVSLALSLSLPISLFCFLDSPKDNQKFDFYVCVTVFRSCLFALTSAASAAPRRP